MKQFQILLDAPQCSGRGVRFRLLSPDECNKVLLQAAKSIGSEGTVIEMKKLEWQLGVRSMITEVTTQDGLNNVMEAKWKKMSHQELDMEYANLFTAKDDAILQAVYRQYHEVNESEIQAIVGKALPVSTD